jgi:pentatricopeptide repeat protein
VYHHPRKQSRLSSPRQGSYSGIQPSPQSEAMSGLIPVAAAINSLRQAGQPDTAVNVLAEMVRQGLSHDEAIVELKRVMDFEVEAEEAADDGKTGRSFRFVSAAEAMKAQTNPEWLVRPFIEAAALCSLFGEANAGKTFLVLAIALSVATGSDWHGHKVRRSGPVLYVCGEGRRGVLRRVKAWQKKHGITAEKFFISSGSAALLDPANVQAICDEADRIAGLHGDPALIVIDTLARNFGNGNENDTGDMNTFVAALDYLKDQHGAAVIVVHHSGLASTDRGRGSSVFKGALDFEFAVKKAGQGLTLSCTKVKDFEPPADKHFAFEPVGLGEYDEDGEEVSSCVLIETDRPAEVKPLTENQKLGLSSFRAATVLHGPTLHIEDWRASFYEASTSENAEAKRKAFNRARKELVALEKLSVTHDRYTLIEQPGHGTSAGHLRDMSRQEAGNSGTTGTHTYRCVPCPAPDLEKAGSSESLQKFNF